VETAYAGDFIGISDQRHVIARHSMTHGMIIRDRECKIIESFRAQVTVFRRQDMKRKLFTIKAGYFMSNIDVHTDHVNCHFRKIIHLVNNKSGKAVASEEPVIEITSGQTALIEMVPVKFIQIEEFGKFRKLGRFIIRKNNEVIGCGIVKEITYKEKDDRKKKK